MGKMRNGQAEHLTLVKPNQLQESDRNSTPQTVKPLQLQFILLLNS